MALLIGAAPTPAAEAAAQAALIKNIVTTQHNHVTVGIIGTKALFALLRTAGQVQTGIDLAEQTTQVGLFTLR